MGKPYTFRLRTHLRLNRNVRGGGAGGTQEEGSNGSQELLEGPHHNIEPAFGVGEEVAGVIHDGYGLLIGIVP
jgi:hypothetical protein